MRAARRILAALGLLLLSACAHDVAAPPGPWIDVRKFTRTSPTPLVAWVAAIDLDRAPGTLRVSVEHGEGGLVAATVRRLAERDGLAVAVNASFFELPGGKYPEPGVRVDAVGGLLLEGKTVVPAGPGLGRGLLNAGFCVEGRRARVEKGFECKGATWGLASGPLLLWHGEPVDTAFAEAIFKTPRHPRTAVGVDTAKGKLWFLVVDGRQPGVSDGATLDDLKTILKELGAVDALNFDGGGSSTLVTHLPGEDLRVVNVPVHDHTPGHERPVATAVGIRAAPASSTR